MSEAPNLAFLGARVGAVQDDLRDALLRFAGMEARLTAIEARMGGIEARTAGMEARLDRVLAVLGRIAHAQGLEG